MSVSRYRRFGMVLLLICTCILFTVPAHVPIQGEGNEHLDSAQLIENPTKSWVVYDHLDPGGEARYYRMEMNEGDPLFLSLIVPEQSEFVPGMVVMGPGLIPAGEVPDFIEVPAGTGAVVIGGMQPDEAEYEPFTPSALYPVTGFQETVVVPGTYYIAVYEPVHGGNFSLAIGQREEFSLSEWILVPISTIGIHLWEGQPLLLVLAPVLMVVFGGFALILIRERRGDLQVPGIFGWLGVLSGLLYIGSAGIVFLQMIFALLRTGPDPAALVTLIYIVLPALLGIAALWVSIGAQEKPRRADGVKMFLLGVFGLFIWAGLIAGPVLAISAGVLGFVMGER